MAWFQGLDGTTLVVAISVLMFIEETGVPLPFAPGDLVLAMSVSGDSPNVVKAVDWANRNGLHTIALVGGKRGKLAELARQAIVINDTHYGRAEDAHMGICHMICYAFMENPWQNR